MKNAFFRISCLFLMFCGFVHAQQEDRTAAKFVPCEKFYIESNQINVTQDGIFILNEDSWIMTDAIRHDGSRLYVSSLSEEWSVTWTCPYCNHVNGILDKKCQKCGYRP